MNVKLNTKNKLVKPLFTTEELGLSGGVTGITTEVNDNTGGAIANNSYAWNSTYEALRVNDSSTNKKGMLSIPLGYVQKGDIVNIKCEVFNISGVKVKFAMDFYTVPSMEALPQNILGTSDIFQTDKSGGFEDVDISLVCPFNGYVNVGIGVFTADIADYYIRNIEIKTDKPNHDFNRIVKTNRMYTFNGLTLATDFSFDTCTTSIDDLNPKTLIITHNKPFTCTQKRGLSVVKTNGNDMAGKTLELRSSAENPTNLKIRVYDHTINDYVNISTALVSGVWFSVVQYGYDYSEDI